MNRNLWLMVAAQALFMTNNIVFVAVNGLVGLSIAPFTWLATLPIMGYVLGGALVHRRQGRSHSGDDIRRLSKVDAYSQRGA